MQKENDLLREQIESLNTEMRIMKEDHSKELVDLEFNLKVRYEDIIKNKLKQQKNEFEGRFNNIKQNKAKVENSLGQEPEE